MLAGRTLTQRFLRERRVGNFIIGQTCYVEFSKNVSPLFIEKVFRWVNEIAVKEVSGRRV